jgi:hypothetical protein
MQEDYKTTGDSSLELRIKAVDRKIADAALSGDFKKIELLNIKLDSLEAQLKTTEQLTEEVKSSRFTRPKTSNFRQNNPVMGYAKPTEQRKISHKYHCMVSGEKRMNPCGGCSNPKGCLSNSMQYKEQDQ